MALIKLVTVSEFPMPSVLQFIWSTLYDSSDQIRTTYWVTYWHLMTHLCSLVKVVYVNDINATNDHEWK